MPYKIKTITIAVITAVSMLIPTLVYPLGIGNIRLQSRLNQKLKAEIELLDSANEDISSLYVNLAPIGKFSEAKIPWSYSLRNIKFKPIKRANGSIVIEVSSKEVFKELFLNFILEVSWNKGVLYREFTVLFDPPVDYNPPIFSALPEIKQDVITEFEFSKTWVNKKTADKKNRTQYGPIKPSDYIRKIAKKTRYDDVSIEQMIMALFKANPEAFFTDNINALVEKKMLKIPKKEIALELSRKAALEQVNLQNNIWQERIAAKKRVSQSGVDIAKNNAQIPLEDSQTKTSVSPIPKNDSNVNQDEKQLTSTATSSEILLAILARLDKLEQKVDVMQNIVVSKDKPTTIASTNETSSQGNVDAKIEPSASRTEELALLARLSELEQKVETMQKMLNSKDELIASLQEQNKTTTALQEKPIPNSVAITKEPINSTAATKTIAKTHSAPIMQTFIQQLKTHSMLLLEIATVGGIFLSVLGGFLWFNKKKQQQAEIDAINEYLKPLDLAKSSFQDLDVPLNDFLTDKHLYNIDVEDKEMDIGMEIDLYIGFSDYKQAEYLARQAIEAYPDNNDYKLKLLDIFVASHNNTAFDSFKIQLENMVNHSDQAFWRKVKKIEKALISVAPVYRNKKTEQIIPEIKEDSVKKTDINITANESLANNTKIESNEIEFDKYDFDDIDIKPITEANSESIDNSQTTESNEIEFDKYDFDDIDIKPITEANSESIDNSQTIESNEIEFDKYDFDDIDIKPITEANSESIDNSQTTESNEIEFDKYDFDDIDIKPMTEANSELIDNSETTKSNDINFDFDMYAFDDVETKPIEEANNESIDNNK